MDKIKETMDSIDLDQMKELLDSEELQLNHWELINWQYDQMIKLKRIINGK